MRNNYFRSSKSFIKFIMLRRNHNCFNHLHIRRSKCLLIWNWRNNYSCMICQIHYLCTPKRTHILLFLAQCFLQFNNLPFLNLFIHNLPFLVPCFLKYNLLSTTFIHNLLFLIQSDLRQVYLLFQ